MTKFELERALEDRCVAKIEAAGGMALKLSIPGVRGFPDRLILGAGAPVKPYEVGYGLDIVRKRPTVWFAEFKRKKTGVISAQQHRWRVMLHQMGFGAYFIDSDQQFDEAVRREALR